MAKIDVTTPGLSVTQGPNVIFETTWANDGAYSLNAQGLYTEVNVPTGWHGAQAAGDDAYIMGVPGAGDGGSVAMRYIYDGDLTTVTNSMLRHLTGQTNTGHPELYIRYNLKLPNNFRWGSGETTAGPWKWGRLWQNTAMPPRPGGNSPGSWTENRQDSYYIVWNWSGSESFGVVQNITYGANATANGGLVIGPTAREHGSAGGPRRRESSQVEPNPGVGNFKDTLGYWEQVGGGDWDFTAWTPDGADLVNNTSQVYHTFEWRFKCATTDTANDGITQLWIDGVLVVDSPWPTSQNNPVTQGPQKRGDITDVSNANPAVITLVDNRDGFVTGDTVRVVGVDGTLGSAVNGTGRTITEVDDTHWELDGIDTTSLSTHTPDSGDYMDISLPSTHFTGIPTAANPGFNALSLFDNIQTVNKDWNNPAVDGYIDINDVVIATSRIGHTTQVGGVPGYVPKDDGSGFPL